MSQNESSSFGRFLFGLFAGVVLTVLYVRFGFVLPGALGWEQKVISKAIVTAAEMDLYNPNSHPMVQRRALAIVLANKPETFLEIDAAIGNRFFNEFMRRKADRKSQLIRSQSTGIDLALKQPNLAKYLSNKSGSTDEKTIKNSLLIGQIRDDKFLHNFLRLRYPDASDEVLSFLVKHPEITDHLRLTERTTKLPGVLIDPKKISISK